MAAGGGSVSEISGEPARKFSLLLYSVSLPVENGF